MPLTITKLARKCGLCRTTVLYYESLGLLRPARRSASNYRMYSDTDLARLREVCAYRASGLKLGDIRSILDRPSGEAAAIRAGLSDSVDLSSGVQSLRRVQSTGFYLEFLQRVGEWQRETGGVIHITELRSVQNKRSSRAQPTGDGDLISCLHPPGRR